MSWNLSHILLRVSLRLHQLEEHVTGVRRWYGRVGFCSLLSELDCCFNPFPTVIFHTPSIACWLFTKMALQNKTVTINFVELFLSLLHGSSLSLSGTLMNNRLPTWYCITDTNSCRIPTSIIITKLFQLPSLYKGNQCTISVTTHNCAMQSLWVGSISTRSIASFVIKTLVS